MAVPKEPVISEKMASYQPLFCHRLGLYLHGHTGDVLRLSLGSAISRALALAFGQRGSYNVLRKEEELAICCDVLDLPRS